MFVLMTGNAMRDRLLGFLEARFSPMFFLELCSLLLPYAIKYALPPALLMGILLGLGRLSADCEITAMRAVGMSLGKIVAPIFCIALLLATICFYINSWATPRARTGYKEKLAKTATENPLFFFEPGTFIRDFPGYILYVGGFDGENLRDFWVWSTTTSNETPDENLRIRQTMRFDSGKITYEHETNTLILQPRNLRVEINDKDDPENFQGDYHPGVAASTVLRFSLDAHGQNLNVRRKPSMMTRDELIERRDALEALSNPTAEDHKKLLEARVQLQSNASMACSVIAFAAIGIPLAIRTGRKETMINVAIALGLALGYYVLMILLELAGNRPGLRPELLTWLPNALFLLWGMNALRRLE